MLPPNPAIVSAAKKMRIASVLTTILIIATVTLAIYASNNCNAICTDLYYFYECYRNGDLYCCSSSYCSGSCFLKTSSCNGLSVAAGICGFFLLISIVAMFIFACKLRSMQREAMLNGNMGIPPYSNGNLVYPNQQYPQPQYYNNNNQPFIYGNNPNNQPLIYGNNPPNQGNPYQQGNNNYVAPQYYNNQQWSSSIHYWPIYIINRQNRATMLAEPNRCDTTGKKFRMVIVITIIMVVQTIVFGVMAY